MTSKNHWGIHVNSEAPITGVLNSTAPEFLYEDAIYHGGIDINLEEHCKECKNEYHDDCWTDDEPTYIFGFKKDEKGEYVIDEKAEYSAIVGQIYTQVLMSKWASRCALCSLCFPGQGDLNTPGEFLAYNLPPECWGEGKHLPVIELKEEDLDPAWHYLEE